VLAEAIAKNGRNDLRLIGFRIDAGWGNALAWDDRFGRISSDRFSRLADERLLSLSNSWGQYMAAAGEGTLAHTLTVA
jgi:hypothetical protein